MTGQKDQKVILHIDYDSFFASVEQQANPFLRGKPVVVGGSSLKRGIVCAASREAKKLDVKTGMPFFKAKQLCSNIIALNGDGTKYSYIQKESLKIFAKYTDLIEPFSIDESFLDVTKTLKFFGSKEKLAKLIKSDIKQKFGPFVTCSIGIAHNKLLAKLASNLNKPDGLFIITQDNLLQVVQNAELTDFCGIGRKTKIRLEKHGIANMTQIQDTRLNLLYNEFGNVWGSFLKSASFGEHYGQVKSVDYRRPVKSISHQHTLYKNTQDHQIIKANLQRLCEMVTKRLRKHNMMGRNVWFCLQDKNRQSYGQTINLFKHIDSGAALYKHIEKAFDSMNWQKECQFVAIGVTGLVNKKQYMQPLFLHDQHEENLNKALDKINDKWGSFTIIPAKTLKADRTKEKISSFLKHA